MAYTLASWTSLNLEAFANADNVADLKRREFVGGGQTFRAQVVVDEDHDDDLQITEHPISGGAVIHDHAFKRPAEVRIRLGWSNGYLADNAAAGMPGDVQHLYEQILMLQSSRMPITIYTGKRQYDNMLIASLRTHTDASMEFSFIADVAFREIVLTSTSAWALSSVSYNQGALASPEANSQTIQLGQIQMLPASVQVNNIPPDNTGLFDPVPGQEGLVPLVPHIAPLDQPANPQQAVFHHLPSRIMGPDRDNFPYAVFR